MLTISKKKVLFSGLAILLLGLLVAGCGTTNSATEKKSSSAPAAESSTPAAESKSSSTPAKEAEKTQKPIELKLADFLPTSHIVEKVKVPGYIKAIEEATGGKVKITGYPGGTLLQAGKNYDGIVNGIADMGIGVLAYYRGRFPVMQAFDLPGVYYANSYVASKVAMEGFKELNPKELQDTKVLALFATGPGNLMTKKPVKKLADLKGMQIRATGFSATSLEKLGATPNAMSQSESYEALMKGVVDGNLTPDETLQSYRFADVVKYRTETPFLYNTVFYLVMNKDKWNSLPADVQKAFSEANDKYYDEFARTWDDANAPAMKWATEEKKIETITLSNEETDKWMKQVTPILSEYAANTDKAGLPGQKIIDTVKRLSEKYNAEAKK